MAKHQQTAHQAQTGVQPTLLMQPAVALTPEQAHEADVEALARDLYVAVAPAAQGGGRTEKYLAEQCFALASVFHEVRDARRAKLRQGGAA